VRKVLLIRLDRLGDTLLTTPMIAALREGLSDLELTLLTSPVGTQVLEHDPRVDRLVAFDPVGKSLWDVLKLAGEVRRHGYDAVLAISEKRWPRLITLLSGARHRIGFDPGASQPLKALSLRLVLTDRVPSPNDPGRPSALHEVERYMRLLQPLGIHAQPGPLAMTIGPQDEQWVRGRLDAGGILSGNAPLGVHLSPKWALEGWRPAALVRCVLCLRDALPKVPVVVTHSRAEHDWAAPVAQMCEEAGALALETAQVGQWAAALAKCRLVVTVDTGAVHLAAALGVPVVDIIPSRNFEHVAGRWRPWGVPYRVLRRQEIPDEAGERERDAVEQGLGETIISAVRELL